tara:strand:+ start:1201 stop:1821 length:621 start_codon:yes stop_codon:yes gene_type:complete
MSLRKKLLAVSFLFSSAFTPAAFAESDKEKGFYGLMGVGIGRHVDIDISAASGGGQILFDSGFTGDFGVGYDWGSIRTELAYNYIQNDVSSVQGYSSNVGVEFSSVFLSAYYDFRADKDWQPFVGIGFGSTQITATSSYSGDVSLSAGDDNIVSAKVALGVTYRANDRVDVFGELWGTGYDDFTIGTFTYSDCGVGGLSVGARFKF